MSESQQLASSNLFSGTSDMESEIPGIIDHRGALHQCCRDMKARIRCIKIYLKHKTHESKYNLEILNSKINNLEATKQYRRDLQALLFI